MPSPVMAVLLVLAARSAPFPGLGGDAVDRVLKALGVVLALGGEALRFYTLGVVPEGTSGQGYLLQADELNVRGPYAHVRNPLYLGNLGICAGLLLVANSAWAYLIGVAFFFAEYGFIIRAEENFLREKYGQRYDEYAARVPRWVPRLAPAYTGALRSRIDWARALKKEHNPFAAWASAMLLLLGWQWHSRNAMTTALLALLVSLEFAVLLFFFGVKAFKRGWLQSR